MNEMELARKIMHMTYLFRQERSAGMQQKEVFMTHRDVLMLDAILKLHPKEGMVRMNELSHYFGITPAAVSQMIKNYEKKGWIERVHLEHDRRSVNKFIFVYKICNVLLHCAKPRRMLHNNSV